MPSSAQRLAEQDAKIAAGLRILYGGSVKAGNARELFCSPMSTAV